ncbi:MAG: TolC family protein [Pirellulales bacterium]|nr:TolC family protein [Pirellulales bacterium]
MTGYSRILGFVVFWSWLALALGPDACALEPWRVILPEQRDMQIRDPACLPGPGFPAIPTPPTVTDPDPADACPAMNMSLDEAIRIGLANSEVIRVLGGSSGRTIYDPAVTNTQIDVARGRFDPNLESNNNFYRHESPGESFDPSDPTQVRIGGVGTNDYSTWTGLSKRGPTGATAALGASADPRQYNVSGYPLNPRVPSSVELSLTQPLLQGGGWAANVAPIEIARIDTERSFFQMKDAVQEMVRGVIEGYWALVAARTDLWARQQQVEYTTYALRYAEARLQTGFSNRSDVAQARSSLADFRAALITAKATVLVREAALRNILGLPPSVPSSVVPVSPPSTERLDVSWPTVLDVAAVRRPDLIELKLILEADQQRQILRRNEALPRVDAVALYRWNGLEGRTPDRSIASTRAGQFTEWQLGVNFSVPLGQRAARASLREEELILRRDRADLEQGMHNAAHQLAANYRNLAQYYDQYRAYQESRAASQQNLDVQTAVYQSGQGEGAIYLNVLQAITAWGNAVSAEAQALTAYNTELANLERQAGIILEAHGIRFTEERFASIGPLGRLFADRCYPRDFQPGPNAPRYGTSDEAAENAFNLQNPVPRRKRSSGGASSTEPPRSDSSPSEIKVLVPERLPPPMPVPAQELLEVEKAGR